MWANLAVPGDLAASCWLKTHKRNSSIRLIVQRVLTLCCRNIEFDLRGRFHGGDRTLVVAHGVLPWLVQKFPWNEITSGQKGFLDWSITVSVIQMAVLFISKCDWTFGR